MHCKLTLLLPWHRLPWVGWGADWHGRCVLRCRFAHPGGVHPHPRGGFKAHSCRQKGSVLTQGWRSRGREEGGKAQFAHRPPGSSWHRAHPKMKALGMLRNLIIR